MHTMKCVRTGCDQKPYARGVCGLHYREFRTLVLSGYVSETAAIRKGLALPKLKNSGPKPGMFRNRARTSQ